MSTGTHDDLAVNDIAVFWQNGQNGRRVQKPVNHVNDAVGRYNIGARQVDKLVAQQDLTSVGHCDADNLVGHCVDTVKGGQVVD